MKKSMLLMVLLVLVTVFNSFTIVFAEEDLGSWTTKASMPTARDMLGAVESNGKIYAIGGKHGRFLDTVEEYNPLTDKWTTKASMPTARRSLGLAQVNGKIYAIGGYKHGDITITNIVEEYDPLTNKWTTKANMPTARHCLGVVQANGKIYAIGGYNNNGMLNIVEEYDPVTDKWATKTSMPDIRYGLGLAEVNGKIYAIGGNSGSGLRNIVEEYDPTTDKWTTRANMPTGRYYLGVAQANGKIYAISGIDDSGDSNSVEEYDPATDKWTKKASILTVRWGFGVAEVNGKIYAIGGDSNNNDTNIVEEYTPPSSTTPDKPLNLTAAGGDSKASLSWDSVTGADSYIVKRSTTSGGPYTTIVEDITATNYTDTDVVNGTTYYYVVSAVLSGVESENSNEVSATPEGGSSSGDRALLRVTMSNSVINEYDLSMSEIKDFIDWYEDRGDGKGNPYYIFNKDYNIGPFTSRRDYIASDKISQFEVMEYNR